MWRQAIPADGEAAGESYLWDAALRKGLTIRNYGCFGDLVRVLGPGGQSDLHPA
jgi:hypothetical protein